MAPYLFSNPSLNLTTRPCQKDDRDFILQIYKETLFKNIREYFEPNVDMFDARYYEDYDQKSILLHDGNEMGMYQSVPEEGILYIKGIFLKPEYHGKGIGKLLMLYFEELAIDLSIPIIRLHVWDNNPAKKFYEYLGYKIVSTEKHKHLMEKNTLKIIDKNGNKLIKLHKLPEESIMEYFPTLSHSLVVGIQNNRVLFVNNNWKKEWELAGGVKEEGESPRECAVREMYEESLKTPIDLIFHSVMEWRLGKDQKEEYGALYTCQIEGEAETLNTEEIGKTCFWDLKKDIGEYAELDKTLSIAVLKGIEI